MTMPRLDAMHKYWEQHPPVHLVVAALAGIETVKKAPEPELGIADFMRAVGG